MALTGGADFGFCLLPRREMLDVVGFMRIAYFVHNVDDAAVLKRIVLLRFGGASVKLVGFTRFAFDERPERDPTPVVLGRTYDSKFALRILSVVKAMVWPFRLIRIVRGSDVIICRNLEMLALGYVIKGLSRSKAPLNYESLDIHRKLLGSGVSSRLLRRIESYLMGKGHALITSSPAFITNYFTRIQNYKGRVCLIENKVLPDTVAPVEPGSTKSPPWVIGWFGIIRCRRSLELLKAITELLPSVQVVISGRVADHEFDDFEAQVRASPNIRFTGAYSAEDLAKIYSQAHFVWAIDYFEEGDNSAWLLPNRLYDSLAFGCVPIALASVETGRWLSHRNAGVVINHPLEDLPGFLANLTEAEYDDLRQSAAGIKKEDVFHSETSAKQLVSAIQ